MSKTPLRLALLISGQASTASHIIRHFQNSNLILPSLVIGSSPRANLENTISAGLAKENTTIINPKDFSSSNEFAQALLIKLEKHQINIIGQYGWLARTPQEVIERYKDYIINQHPGPLAPRRGLEFGGVGMFGLRVHAARLLFVRATQRNFTTEATAHRVTDNYDEGAILGRRVIDILDNDSPESLAQRLLKEEHILQTEILEQFARNEIQEWTRPEPLVYANEKDLLIQAKQEAIAMF